MAEAFPISGSVDPKAFPFLLMDLHRQGATGSLKVDGPSYQKALYFRAGRILFGSSNDPRDQLGAILIESGRISPEQLEEVNAKVGSGNPLAKVLSDSGFVSQRELGEAARAKVERILSDVIAYDSGSFEFEDGVLPKGAVDLKLSTERLVLAAVGRISDRNFVLRHVDGLETVFTPTGAMAAAIADLGPEAAGLPEVLDGRLTLKEAAAQARLDEFEAAKIACGLLFLGLVQVEASEAGADATSELDLEQTARMAFDRPAEAPPATVIMEPPPLPEPATAASEVGFAFVESPRLDVDAEPIVIDADPAPIEEAPTLILPESPVLPAPTRAAPPLVHPPSDRPRTGIPSRATPPAATPPPRPPARPSKDDLAALDALLNTRSVEGPLAPLEKPAQTWEPKFGRATGRTAKRPAGGLRLLPLVAVAVLVLLGSAGLAWRFLGASTPTPPAVRPASSAPSARPTPRPASAPPSPAAATESPAILASSPPDMSSPAMTPTTPEPAASATPPPAVLPTPATTRATPGTAPTPAPAASAGTTLAEARALLRRGQHKEAARVFASNLRQSAPGGFSIQLLVACSDETVGKALAAVPDPDLYILPVNYKGRPCYRVCWGLYDSEQRAESATRAVPDYFRNSGTTPRVVPTSGLLP